MKQIFLIGVLGALALLVLLATVFGVDTSPQGILEVLGQALAAIADFFTNFWEGLL